VGLWAASNAIPAIWQDWENWVFDRGQQDQTANVGDYLSAGAHQIARGVATRLGLPVGSEPSAPLHTAVRPPVRECTIRTDSLIGRLTIPRLHLRTIVREGAGNATLSLAAGHIPGTAFPWQRGNVAVAGHRDTLFRGLGEIRKKDLIEFDTLDASYVYEVASTQIVGPQDVSVLKPGQYPELTLVTCYPFNFIGSAPERFIVKAQAVLQASAEQSHLQQPGLRDATPSGQDVKSKATTPARVSFHVARDHSRQLTRGISLGVTATDAARQQMNGWMWLMPDRRTVWLRDRGTQDPLVFYVYEEGRRRELVITRIGPDSVTGYLVL
jgi:LPXTG-site transpeptidase (sortase) family protein